MATSALGLLQGFVASLALVALLAVQGVALTARGDDASCGVAGRSLGAVLRNSWVFTTQRPNMPHWRLGGRHLGDFRAFQEGFGRFSGRLGEGLEWIMMILAVSDLCI